VQEPEPVATAQEPTTAGVAFASAAVRVQVVAWVASSAVVPATTIQSSAMAGEVVAEKEPGEAVVPDEHAIAAVPS